MKGFVLIFLLVLPCSIGFAFVGKGIEKEKTTKANVYADNQAQARQHNEDFHKLKLEREEQLQPDKIAMGKKIIYWVGHTIIVAFVAVVVAGTISVSNVLWGVSKAMVIWLIQQARLIRPDKNGLLPVYIYELNGVPRIYRPDISEVKRLDKEYEPVQQLMLNDGAIKLALVEANAPYVIKE